MNLIKLDQQLRLATGIRFYKSLTTESTGTLNKARELMRNDENINRADTSVMQRFEAPASTIPGKPAGRTISLVA